MNLQSLEQLQVLLDFIGNPDQYQQYLMELKKSITEMKQIVGLHNTVETANQYFAKAEKMVIDAQEQIDAYKVSVQNQLDVRADQLDTRETELNLRDKLLSQNEQLVKQKMQEIENWAQQLAEQQQNVDVQERNLATQYSYTNKLKDELESKVAQAKKLFS